MNAPAAAGNSGPVEPGPGQLTPRILVVEDEPTTLALLSKLLERGRMAAYAASGVREAGAVLSQTVPDVAVVDVYLGDGDGLALVRELRGRIPELGVVVISAEDTESLAGKALESGADYFLSKPISPAALLLTIRKLIELKEQRRRTADLQRELARSLRDTGFPGIITQNDTMKSVLRLVEKVASRDLAVLVHGESGTGKELVARAIHDAGPRAKGAFVELNCAALPPNLVESELFGHEKGSFTGAIATRSGKIEQANGGTLFLDEIGELPLEVQPKLLRALQERRITRVGGAQSIESDFRLISATNRDLVEEMRMGRFREDLFYRIGVFPIKLPPLRERREDVDLLMSHFFKQEKADHFTITPAARALLLGYPWPGNIRELRNFTLAIALLAEDSRIDEADVRGYLGTRLDTLAPPRGDSAAPRASGPESVRRLEDVEREEILHALRVFKGDVPESARALGMGRATLYKYIRRTGIHLPDFAG
ncbi:MAG: sigma-54 dependent transcriptional regulator [Candidatus Sumerlaeia bacterium]|nr:sigma-54 dependent transcriptional regulator [Candidatus Sumerlaeia bacterium]